MQTTLAREVAASLAGGGTLIAEAGTGTGKTLAYAVPALQLAAQGLRVTVSTGTRALQEQLTTRDLPRCSEALGVPVQIAGLKGRANYYCHHRAERAWHNDRFHQPGQAAGVSQARDWAGASATGDLAEAPAEVRDVAEWITASPEQCLAGRCAYRASCFFYQARDRARAADVVVVNHHLLLADWAVKDAAPGAVLPQADALIMDEAHQLPDIAGRFFGHGATSRTLAEIVRELFAALRETGLGDTVLAERGDQVQVALAKAHDALARSHDASVTRAVWDPSPEVLDAFSELAAEVEGLSDAVALLAGHDEELDHLLGRLAQWSEQVAAFIDPAPAEAVQWFERTRTGFTLHATPLQVGSAFRSRLEREVPARVLTSATLTVGGQFDAFRARIGLEDPDDRTLLLPSPFDYPEQTRLYVPVGMPRPGTPAYDERVLEEALQVLETTPGGAFFLFTSHRALEHAAAVLPHRTSRPVLVQGAMGHAMLVQRFVDAGDAILLGTATFREGVDVPGSALSLVVIDRLPFASPGDPVVHARMHAIDRTGGASFTELLLPEAVIALKQGAGRLIREERDRGVLMIADPRLLQHRYGTVFLDSLPPMPLTRSLDDVHAFQTGRVGASLRSKSR